jgi:hypothetical protein
MSNSMSSEQHPETRFFDLFKALYDAGRGRPGLANRRYPGWTPKDFLDAMEKAGSAPSEETLAHWLAGQNVPLPAAKDAFLQVFFPKAATDKQDHTDRDELAEAWQAAWVPRRVTPRKRAEPRAPNPMSQWEDRPGYEYKGLVEFRLETPVASNEDPDVYWLPATLRFGVASPDLEGIRFTIAVRVAHLDILETGYRLASGTLIGDSGRLQHDNFVRKTGDSEAIAPKPDGVHLNGPVLAEPTNIAAVRPAVKGRGPLTAQIAASPIQIDIEISPDTAGPPGFDMTNKTAVLKALMTSNYRTDALGRVVLARRRMERKRAE